MAAEDVKIGTVEINPGLVADVLVKGFEIVGFTGSFPVFEPIFNEPLPLDGSIRMCYLTVDPAFGSFQLFDRCIMYFFDKTPKAEYHVRVAPHGMGPDCVLLPPGWIPWDPRAISP